ncbi:heme exporter protein CcmD [Natronospira bacteriovora]|uniref:Heme exporter protein D n=1 Tax=Natronospira bacteriovora TaxID=3069753 RepID=A0ABU0WA11_9GAMM|nr:heme exporter protein CcmD [Natronospira sp. AB-CW4]MDQ2070748.1 heme exporter protein CcmD [Natronospira sp. AB-CW4]
MSEFLYMDGFALWVWSSFGLTAFIMTLAALLIRRRHRQMLQHVRRYHAAGGSR